MPSRKGYREDCGTSYLSNGGGIAPAGNLVLKTSGTRDGMGIDTSLRRQLWRGTQVAEEARLESE